MRPLLLLTTLLFAAPVHAQMPAPDRARFQAYVGSDAHRDIVRRTIATIPGAILPRCPTLASDSSRVITMQAPTFGAGDAPTAGAWKEEFPVAGCGPAITVNLFFRAQDGNVQAIAGLLGTTHADPLLQRDAAPIARAGASRVARDCPALMIARADFDHVGLKQGDTPPPGPPGKQPWSETWTFAGCGLMVDVPMQFVPDATGTQILQPSEGVRLH